MANLFDDDDKVPARTADDRTPLRVTAEPAPKSSNLFDDPNEGLPPPPKTVQRGPARPGDHPSSYGELKPANVDWTQALKWKGAEALRAIGFLPQHARHFSEGMVDAGSLFPPMGAVLSGLNMQHYGSQGNLGRAALEGIGLIPGATMANRARTGIPTRSLAETPTEPALRQAKTIDYNRVAASPVEYAPTAMIDASNVIRRAVQQRYNPATARATFGSIEEGPATIMQNRVQMGGPLRPSDFDQYRQFIQRPGVPMTQDRAASARAVEALDHWMANTPRAAIQHAPPGALDAMRGNLERARGNTAALKRSETLSGKIDKSDIQHELQDKNIDDSTRNWITSLLTSRSGQRELLGWNAAERAGLRRVGEGDLVTRAARNIDEGLGNWLGRSVAGAGLGAGTAAVTGADPWSTGTGAIVGATAAAGAGRLARGIASGRTARAAEQLGETLRQRSPVYQGRLAAEAARGGPPIDPLPMYRDAITYALMPQVKNKAVDWYEDAMTPYENR